MKERIRAARAAEITGLSLRTIQYRATEIPGAAKLFGTWTFDEAKLRAWVADQEGKVVAKRESRVRAGGATYFDPKAKEYEEAYDRLIGRKLNAPSGPGRRGRRAGSPAKG